MTMQPAHLKQHMSRDNELRLPVTACGVSSERVVAGHVRVNDFDFVSRDKPREFVCARHVQRVAQRQRLDFFAIDFQVTQQR